MVACMGLDWLYDSETRWKWRGEGKGWGMSKKMCWSWNAIKTLTYHTAENTILRKKSFLQKIHLAFRCYLLNVSALYCQRLEVSGFSYFNQKMEDCKPAFVGSGTCPSFWFFWLSALVSTFTKVNFKVSQVFFFEIL